MVSHSNRALLWFPVGLFVCALLLRLVGVDWDGRHPDESIGDAARLLTGDFRVRNFYYPPLLTYLVAGAYIPLYVLGRLLGWWASSADFRAAYFAEPKTFLVTARVVVAICSASAAPLSWALARQVGLTVRGALLVGICAAVLPGSIYWAHIAKSDSGIGPAILLVVSCALYLLQKPAAKRGAILLGVAAAIAVSFKQSAIFFLLPALATLVLWSFKEPRTRGIFVKAWLFSVASAAIAGGILNLALLFDLRAFLDAQTVQSQMSFRSAPVSQTAEIWLSNMTSNETGLPLVAILVAAALWLAGSYLSKEERSRLLLVVLAAGWLVGTVVICVIAGSRQPSHLWLPFMVVGVTAAAIGGALLADKGGPAAKAFGMIGLIVMVLSEAYRTLPILAQATAPSVAQSVVSFIRTNIPMDQRIASSIDVRGRLPLSSEADVFARARHERLARKYRVTLPPADRPVTSGQKGYTVVDFPWVIGGLEDSRPDQFKVVMPYGWPLQPEEWRLSTWERMGFNHFVVSGADNMKNDPVPAYRSFFRELDTCQRLTTIEGKRPLFGEADVTVYRCRAGVKPRK